MKLTDITVTRAIPAAADNVFDVWMDPKSPGGPWFRADRLIMNPVVDGLIYFAVKHEGRTWPHYGRFVSIVRPHRVEYTWVSEGTEGVETVVAVTFEPRGSQCEVTLATRESRTTKLDASTRKAGLGSYRCSRSASFHARRRKKPSLSLDHVRHMRITQKTCPA